jgi:hypothetical protein
MTLLVELRKRNQSGAMSTVELQVIRRPFVHQGDEVFAVTGSVSLADPAVPDRKAQ